MNEATKALPALLFIQPYLGNGFLPQNIEPSPAIQLAQDFYRPKFGVANQKNRSSFREQLANIGKQSQLLPGSTMPSDMFDPSPGNRNAALPIGQADDQQLVSKTNLRPIHDQTNLSNAVKLGFQPLTGYRFIPRSHSNSWIIQQPTQSSGGTQQLGWTGYLPRNAAQIHRPALIDPDDQPDKVSNLGHPLSWSQFTNPMNPGIIEVVDRHWVTPFRKMVGQNRFYWRTRANQLFGF